MYVKIVGLTTTWYGQWQTSYVVKLHFKLFVGFFNIKNYTTFYLLYVIDDIGKPSVEQNPYTEPEGL